MNKQYLTDMATVLKSKLPDNYGFILLAFPFGESENGRLVYTANCHREDAINTMKEFLLRCGASEDWMQHIK